MGHGQGQGGLGWVADEVLAFNINTSRDALAHTLATIEDPRAYIVSDKESQVLELTHRVPPGFPRPEHL